jgi:hypothetical protein
LLTFTHPQPPVIDPNLPLIVGDCIHNLRSALDHLVFQLAILKGTGTEAAAKTAFPIYLTAKSFKNFVDSRVAPFIERNALTEIERLQPYARGNAGEQDIIWVLSQLDIIDKHRLLVVAVHMFRPFRIAVTGNAPLVMRDFAQEDWKAAKDGAEIVTFDMSQALSSPTPSEMHVDIITASTVQIVNTGLVCDGMPVQQVLSDSMAFVTSIVDGFGAKFFGEL